eukprot:98331_1
MSSNRKGSDNGSKYHTNNKPTKSHITPRSYGKINTTSVHQGYMAHRSHMNSSIPSISSSSTLPHSSTASSRLSPNHKPRSSPPNDDRRRSRLLRAQRHRYQRIIESFNDSMFNENDLRFDDTQVTISNNGRTITISTFSAFDPDDPDGIATSDSSQTRSEFANKLLQFYRVVKNQRLDEEPSTN